MAWGKETEWGYRVGRDTTWIGGKTAANNEIKKLKRRGIEAKLVQHQVPKQRKPAKTKVGQKLKDKVPEIPRSTCQGGKCKKNGVMCKKHLKDVTSGSEYSLDGIHARWDEPGHRWS